MASQRTIRRAISVLWPFVRPHRRKLLLVLGLLSANALLKLPIPFLTIYIIDHVIAAGTIKQLASISLVLVLMSAAFIFAEFLRSVYSFRVSRRVFGAIHVHLLEHVQKLPFNYFTGQDTGYIMSRFLDDAALLNTFATETLLTFIQNVAVFLIGVLAIFYIHWRLALVSLFLLPWFLISNIWYGNRLRVLNEAIQEEKALNARTLHETLSGILMIKAFAREKWTLWKSTKNVNRVVRSELKTFVFSSKISMLISFLGSLGPLVVLCYGGYEVIGHRLTLGQLMAFNGVLGYLYGPSQILAGMYIATQRSLSAMGRVADILQLPMEPGYARPGTTVIHEFNGDVSFERVSFAYHAGKNVLDKVSFNVNAGSVVALIGASGAGKSTLVNLLLRLNEPCEGTIYIDGEHIRSLDIHCLRRQIGLVSQDTFLFNTSITENIRFGRRDASDLEVTQAAELANVHEFAARLPKGYDTVVGRMGYQLSAGQRQRIALARAVLKNPRILILDEATSSVDSQSEQLIWNSLKTFVIGRTTFLISHRLSSVLNAELTLALQDGRLISIDKQDPLLWNTVYQDLYKDQLQLASRR